MNDQQIEFNINDNLKCRAKADKVTENPTNSWKQLEIIALNNKQNGRNS